MAPRLPTASDFPPNLTLSIIPPPSSSPSSTHPLNILLLLHGLGDTHAPFTTLGKSLSLPSTTCISIRAPSPISAIFTGSDIPSFHWGDDVLIDEQKGDIDLDAGFEISTRVLTALVKEVLIQKCGYKAREIFFLGFGQGGMAAVQTVSKYMPQEEFGGVISIGGKLPSSSSGSGGGKNRTPVLVCGGSKSREITRSSVDGLKRAFSEVEYVKWEKADDSMPRNREEMLPLMKLLARRLSSRAGVPEGAVEV